MSIRRPGPATQLLLVVAAVAIAIAIPLGLKIGSDDDQTPPSAGGASRNAIGLEGLRTGPAPRTGYLRGTTFIIGGQKTALRLQKGSVPTSLGVLDGGFLVGTRSADGTEGKVEFIPADGSAARSWPAGRGNFLEPIVVSKDGKLGAFITGLGKTVVVQDHGSRFVELPRIAGTMDLEFEPVGITGTDCSRGTGKNCTVLAYGEGLSDSLNDRVRTWRVTPDHPPVPANVGINEVRTVAANGQVAGVTRIIEDGDGACAGVATTARKVLWTSCKDRLTKFSPDSRHVLGTHSTIQGFGDREVTVFDARTGKKVLHLAVASRNVGIHQMFWEDNSHVLLVVSQGRLNPETEQLEHIRYAVIRVALDGSREYAVAPVAQVVDYTPALVLPNN